MSELQDALDFWDETIGPTESLLPNTTKTIVAAARKVANPDYEAAFDTYKSHVEDMALSTWDLVGLTVDAALGITEET